jgi:predicted 2-oxoglutarate/Fe(II)-dependent dioxygenase YbiX/peroxiredoxin
MIKYINLTPGDPAPLFFQRTLSRPRYTFDTAAGRYLVLCFYGSAAHPRGQAALAAALELRSVFDDQKASFFGVSIDPRDESEKRIAERLPGYRHFLDLDGQVSRLYGALPADGEKPKGEVRIRQLWVVVDPTMRILTCVPFAEDGSDIPAVRAFLGGLPPPERHVGFEVQAPVLVLPNVFEPEFCRKLVGLYEAHGGQESGFMREVDGKTVAVTDPEHKRRRDYVIADAALKKETQLKFSRRVMPQLLKAYQYRATRMERYIVACYAAEDEAHFRAHRDNTTKGTAHRRFAVSINLNADFDGGEISFPEYGPRSIKIPVGAAVVFSCSLLHAVSKVTRGRRYAFLPFLYDDEAAKLREANNAYLDESLGQYKPA